MEEDVTIEGFGGTGFVQFSGKDLIEAITEVATRVTFVVIGAAELEKSGLLPNATERQLTADERERLARVMNHAAVQPICKKAPCVEPLPGWVQRFATLLASEIVITGVMEGGMPFEEHRAPGFGAPKGAADA